MYSKYNTSLHSDLGSGSQGFQYLSSYSMLEAAENTPKKGWRKRQRLARAGSRPSFAEVARMSETKTVNRIKVRLHVDKKIACEQAHTLGRAKPLIEKIDDSNDTLSVLPSKEISELIRSNLCTLMVTRPALTFVPEPSLDHLKHVAFQVQDAFLAHIESPEGNVYSILPREVLQSPLAARRKQGAEQTGQQRRRGESLAILPSEILPEFITQITNPAKHFSAAIFYVPEEREVVLGFNCSSAMYLKGRLLLSHLLNLMGFCPKAFSYASKLTKIIKLHLEKVNELLPADHRIGITITGTFIGGAYAMYAALRNRLYARVINPASIGSGLLRRLGNISAHDVEHSITEVVVRPPSREGTALVCQHFRMSGFYTTNLIRQARHISLPADSTYSNDPDIYLYRELVKNKQTEITLRTYLKHFLLLLVEFRVQGVEMSRRALREFTQGKITRAILELFERMPSGLTDSAKQEVASLMQQRYDAAFEAIEDPRYAIDLVCPYSENISALIIELQEASPLAKHSNILEAILKDCEADKCRVLKRRASTLAERFAPRLRSYLSKGPVKRSS